MTAIVESERERLSASRCLARPVFRLRRLTSIGQLRAVAAAWDDLWHRSTATTPSARADAIAVWLETFAPTARLAFCVAEDTDGRLLAALPLVHHSHRGLPSLELPGNSWCPAGELLVDPHVEPDYLLPALWQAAARWPAAWVKFSHIDLHSPHWRLWLAALESAGGLEYRSDFGEVGLIDVEHNAEAYEASRSKNLRKQMRQIVRRLERDGGVALEVYDRLAVDEVEPLLRRGFAIEDRSWKGQAGSSVLRSPGVFEFFLRQAQGLAASGNLHLVFLVHRDQTLAFEYGWSAKGTYFSPKVGYDPAFAEYCPGQLLRWLLMERFQADPTRRSWDFSGPLAPATRRWITRSYPTATVRVVPGGLRALAARPLLAAYAKLRSARAAGAPVDAAHLAEPESD
ncbi:MAG: GNAT family N-acetyltransferase [Pirellulales bacterium]|nr:GNAT family N-acetyltransferase [Pirellulales bacterium]